MNEPTHLDLFSGIGGFALAAREAGFRTVAFCEIDPYCQRVLAKNFGCVVADSRHAESSRRNEVKSSGEGASFGESASCDRARIHTDIFDFDGTAYRGVTLLTGGFPCQPFSVAGKRRGKEDDRHLWPEMLRVIKEARPAWVLGENVPGIVPMGLDNVLSDLESLGYACRPFVIPACAVDARHRRDRLWIVGRNVAEPSRELLNGTGRTRRRRGQSANGSCDSAYPNGESSRRAAIARSECCEWLAEPDVGRVAHGIPARVDRLRGLGNAIVPQVAFEILQAIRAEMK